MTRIAFIMPTFNRAHFIAEAIDAVIRQIGPDDTFLVIDDGSTDNTPTVVQSYAPRVAYVRQDNRGKSAALNHALALTNSDYVWICDDDDVTGPGAVARLERALTSSDAGFAFGRHTRFRTDGDRRIDIGTGYWPDLSRGSILRHLLEDSFVMQNATLIRRSALAAIGPFGETLPRSIDYDMFVRLALASPGRYVDEIVFAQRKHDGVRGSQSSLHSAATAMAVWAEYDRRVFDKVAATVKLATFEGLFDSRDDDLRRRAALLQRACVWSRHHRWDAAIDDLAAATAIAPGLPLHSVERAICARVLGGKHGFDALLDPGETAARFYSVLAATPIGRAAGWAMVRGILWWLRHHRSTEGQRVRTIVQRMARHTGGRGAMAAWLTPRQHDRLLLRERNQPFASATGAQCATTETSERRRV